MEEKRGSETQNSTYPYLDNCCPSASVSSTVKWGAYLFGPKDRVMYNRDQEGLGVDKA